MRLIALFLVLLAGCVTVEEVSTKLDSWKGRSEQELVRSWGVPTGIYEKGSTRVLTYSSQRNYVYTTNYNNKPQVHGGTQECKINFTVDGDKIVETYWEGHLRKCNRDISPAH